MILGASQGTLAQHWYGAEKFRCSFLIHNTATKGKRNEMKREQPWRLKSTFHGRKALKAS
jgi:hypothetical protein